jgi:hypothetical protein
MRIRQISRECPPPIRRWSSRLTSAGSGSVAAMKIGPGLVVPREQVSRRDPQRHG